MKRVADLSAEVLLIRQLDYPRLSFPIENITKDAIVRSDEELLAGTHQDGSPLRAHPGIDDRDIDGARGKRFVARKQVERSTLDVLGWNVVRDIDQLRSGINRQD